MREPGRASRDHDDSRGNLLAAGAFRVRKKRSVATNDASMSFDDPLDTMVFTTRRVAELKYPVLVVSHDAEDGAWQFLCGTTNDPKDGVTVSLASMLERHPELEELSDLARGWIAWRETEKSTWVREPYPLGNA